MTLFDLQNTETQIFQTMKTKYGIWPTTVWKLDYSDRLIQEIKKQIGDIGGSCIRKGSQHYFYDSQTRKGCFSVETDDKSLYRGKVLASIFNPILAQVILNCYAPQKGVCFDPFAGGGTRAIVAAYNNLDYFGIELRQEEVGAVNNRCKGKGVEDRICIICADARETEKYFDNDFADFCYTCPPYWNLEQYNGGENDLSMCKEYADFLLGLKKVVFATRNILKPNSFSCWVVGLHRDKKGNILALNHDIAKIHQDCGFRFKEEVVLSLENNGAIQRVGSFEKGDRRLIRTHEYLLVFENKK